ncbi:MAP kinase kinase (MEK) [Polyrhizophydium stewartii]|uniref:mitogen-activated protein kinase kinase n=1 Tax=Polyrhizophydium stewartii TaxID=2732419 RepID=A0ABR4N305_9FUNG
MGTKRLGPAPPIDLFNKTNSVGSLADVSLDGAGIAPASRINTDSISKDSKIKFRAEDLQTLLVLGAGSGGVVTKIIKMGVHDTAEQQKLEKQILRELRILRLCQSPRVVSFYGAFLHDGDINIMMEHMDLGTLERVYRKTGPIPERIVGQVAGCILEGLIYLYEHHKIVHRDIKPSNILANSLGEVKIADFGVSKELSNGTQAATFTGTQGYLAPERVREGTACTPASDVWSLGLTLMELAMGAFPIPAEALPSIFDLLEFIENEPSPTLPAGRFSPEFCEFTAACLIKDPKQRPHPKQLLDTAFLRQAAAMAGTGVLAQWTQSLVPVLQQ